MRRESLVAIKIRRSDYLSKGWQLPDTFYEHGFELLSIRNQEVTVVC
jgi:hypothetical protein